FSTAPPVQLTLTLIHLGKKVKGSLKSRDRLFDKSKSRPSTAIVNWKGGLSDFLSLNKRVSVIFIKADQKRCF
ncbi:hypothetical protein, partial [Leptospira adleri]|uniref:hypothetical protein n=2 Tax=Leptospira adleri TaxID=2023186 RepID=UPI001A9C9096